MSADDDLVDRRTAAKILGMSPAGTRYLQARGRLTPLYNDAGELRYRRSEVETLRESRATFVPAVAS